MFLQNDGHPESMEEIILKKGDKKKNNKIWIIVVAVVALFCVGIMMVFYLRSKEIAILLNAGEMHYVEDGNYYVVLDKIDTISGKLSSGGNIHIFRNYIKRGAF